MSCKIFWVALVVAVGPAHTPAGEDENHGRHDRHQTAEADSNPGTEMFGEITDFNIADRHEAHEDHHVKAHHPSTEAIINRALDGSAES